MDMEPSADLTSELHQLVQTHGLTSVLEELITMLNARAQTMEDALTDQTHEESAALRNAASALGLLIEALPEAIDVEIALENMAGPMPSGAESQEGKLPGGLE